MRRCYPAGLTVFLAFSAVMSMAIDRLLSTPTEEKPIRVGILHILSGTMEICEVPGKGVVWKTRVPFKP